MGKIFLLFSLVLTLAINAFGQSAKTTPTPPVDNDVVRISTNLIQLDVTISDSSGKIITDIKPNEIEVYENGKKQEITNFSFIAIQKGSPNNRVATDKNALPTPPKVLRPENVNRAIALVVDDLTLSFESTYYVRRALKKFVDEQMQEGDLIAIIRSGAGIGALQQFTSDKRQLYAAIERVRWNPAGLGKITPFAPIDPSTKASDSGGVGADAKRDPEKDLDDLRDSVYITGTLGAINYVIRGMADLPGRKSIMLLSDGIPMPKDSTGINEQMRRLFDLANQAAVVINTIDARGLLTGGLEARDDVGGMGAQPLAQIMSDRRRAVSDSQPGLSLLAKETGGISFHNNNDLGGGIRKILDNQSYYLVGYQPDSETFDPRTHRYNKLAVKVTRPGVTVRYRSGFFGITDENIKRPIANSNQRLGSALTSPFAVNDVSIHLNALFNNDIKTGSYIRSLLHIRAGDLTFADGPDGSKTAVFDILAAGIGDNGVPIEQFSKVYNISVKDRVYEKFLKEGFVYDFTFPVKQPGAYQLRVALRDRGSDKIGSASQFIEVPDVKKKRLTLSGVYLENRTLDGWNKQYAAAESDSEEAVSTSLLSDTSLRQFKHGTVVSYAFVVFNAKQDQGRKPDLTMQIKVFCDGKLLLNGDPQPIPVEGLADLQRIGAGGSLSLGAGLPAGDYVMQMIVRDLNAKEKQQVSSQFVQFEIVD